MAEKTQLAINRINEAIDRAVRDLSPAEYADVLADLASDLTDRWNVALEELDDADHRED